MTSKIFLLSILIFLSHSFCNALNVTVGSSGATYTTDGSNDEVEIQTAINAVSTAGGGTVTLQDGTYLIQTTYILPKNNVILTGTSRNGTMLTSTRTYSYLIWTNNIAVSNFTIKDMTINALNSNRASGVLLEKASKCRVANVKFIGVTCDGWELVIGIDGTAAQMDNDFSRDILIENCLFDGHQGSLEMLLLYNTKNCRVDNCTFMNKTKGCPTDGNSPVLGLWQKTDSITIANCTFLNNQGREAIYHSNTCDNTLITDCTFTNTGGIHGTNESDWGTFGVPYEKRLIIKNCNMTGGANDVAEAAIKLGAIEGVLIKDCNITGYEEGIVIQSGLAASLPAGAKHFAVVRTNIRNGNTANNFHGLHAGILLQKVGGPLHGFFICGDISSSLAPPKQEQPVAFTTNSPVTFDSLYWLGITITAYNTRPDFKFWDFSAQGSPFIVEKCNGMSPPSYCGNCATMTDAEIEAKIRTYDPITANIMHNLLAYPLVNSVLPVELVNFKGHTEGVCDGRGGLYNSKNSAQNESCRHVFQWLAVSEINTKSYELQRLNSAYNYETVETIDVQNSIARYQFGYYQNTPKSIDYYRLKINDFDGKTTFSKIISLESANILRGVNFYPNPANDVLFIENAEGKAVQIVNILGQKFKSFSPNNNQFQITINELERGIYFIKLDNELIRFIKN